jgi:predicted metal-dependent peptidase
MTDNNNELKALSILRDAYDKLMSKQFFFYNIASQFALKAVDKKQCPTMGVAHIDGVHWLVYNPDFIKYYNYAEISVILEHEISHFTFDHVKEFDSSQNARKIFKDQEEAADHVRKQAEEKYIAKTKNICTDRSINVHLFGLPNIRMSLGDIKMDFTDKEGNIDVEGLDKYLAEGFAKKNLWFKDPYMSLELADDLTILEANCITESSFKSILTDAGYEGDVDKVQKYGTWKYYFDLLMSCPKTEEAVQNIRQMDVHFGDEEGDGEGSRDAQEARDKVMMEAARNSNKHDIPGNLRDHIKNLFDKYSKEAALPWNVILRRMVNASKRSIKKNDVNSRNKYAPGNQILPGYRLDPIKDIAVIWDVSGSCMDEETQTTFIKEVNMMIKAGSQVRVYYTDAAVEHVQDCKEKMMQPKEYEIHGGGGTNLSVGISQAISEGYRIIIQLTDCYMDYPLTKRDLKSRKVITVSTTDAKPPTHYGVCIHTNRK